MPSYSIIHGSAVPPGNKVNEDNVLFTSVDITGVNPCTFLYGTFSCDRAITSDFLYGDRCKTQVWSLKSNIENIKISQTIAANQSTEGDKAIFQRFYLDSARTFQVEENIPITIQDTSNTETSSYVISTSTANTINKGVTLTTTFKTTNIALGKTTYWKTHSNYLSSDGFTFSSPVNGSGTIKSFGKFTFSQILKNDSYTAECELFNLRLVTGS